MVSHGTPNTAWAKSPSKCYKTGQCEDQQADRALVVTFAYALTLFVARIYFVYIIKTFGQ